MKTIKANWFGTVSPSNNHPDSGSLARSASSSTPLFYYG